MFTFVKFLPQVTDFDQICSNIECDKVTKKLLLSSINAKVYRGLDFRLKAFAIAAFSIWIILTGFVRQCDQMAALFCQYLTI